MPAAVGLHLTGSQIKLQVEGFIPAEAAEAVLSIGIIH